MRTTVPREAENEACALATVYKKAKCGIIRACRRNAFPADVTHRKERSMKIIVGITSSISAYKTPALVRLFKKRYDAEIFCVVTEHAQKLVAKKALETVSGNHVITNMWKERDPLTHVNLTAEADIMIIAPATANIIGKLAAGIADDTLTTMAVAFAGSMFLAPAMNSRMWKNPIVQENLRKLKHAGYTVIPPAAGALACEDVGVGRLAELEAIVEAVMGEYVDIALEKASAREFFDSLAEEGVTLEHLVTPQEMLAPLKASLTKMVADEERDARQNDAREQDLRGKTVLVTAGATREWLDAIRYITNRSSGKMGKALAEEVVARGAQCVFIAGEMRVPVPEGCRVVRVETTEEMRDAVLSYTGTADALIMAAAPVDFRPKTPCEGKMKKDAVTHLALTNTPDILKCVREAQHDLLVIAFAAESDDLEKNAKGKLSAKGADAIVANRIDEGFEHDTNRITIYYPDGRKDSHESMPKTACARVIVSSLKDLFAQKA